jgi:membrane-bound ClpP family serine protease
MRSRRNAQFILLLVGMVLLAIGITTDNRVFSWAAVVLVLVVMLLGAGRRRRY